MLVGLRCMAHPPGPCPFLANWTRCSGVKSVNRRFGSGGRSIWPGFGRLFGPAAEPVREAVGREAALFGSKLGPPGILRLAPVLDFWNACVRQAGRASHNPPAASSAATARNRGFGFIVFCCLIQGDDSFTFAAALCADFCELAFDLERRRAILVRNAREQERT